MEKIDVLLATHNGDKYISELLDSLLTQTISDINIIISDDNSTDNTIEIISSYIEKHKNIQLFLNNFGSSNKNFDFLVANSYAKYIAFCDQDDVWLPNKLEKSLEKLVQNNVMLVYSDLIVTDDKLNHLYNFSEKRKNKPLTGKLNFNFILGNSAPGCSMLFKRDIIINDEINDFWHDYKAILRAGLMGDVCYIDEPLILYRQHDNNQLGVKGRKITFDILRNSYLAIPKIIGEDHPYAKTITKSFNKKFNLSVVLFWNIVKSNLSTMEKINSLLLFHANYLYKNLFNLKNRNNG